MSRATPGEACRGRSVPGGIRSREDPTPAVGHHRHLSRTAPPDEEFMVVWRRSGDVDDVLTDVPHPGEDQIVLEATFRSRVYSLRSKSPSSPCMGTRTTLP